MKIKETIKGFSKAFLRYTAGTLSYFYVALCFYSSRIVIEDKNNTLEYMKTNPAILAIWHNTILISAPFFAKRINNKTKVALVSASRDASFLRTILFLLGLSYVKGSTNKISVSNIRYIFSILKDKKGVFIITPDGPVGPRMSFNYGAAQIATTTSAPVVPIYYGIKNGFSLRTWDRLIIPRPFSKITVVFGDIVNPNDFSKDAENKELSKFEKIENLRLSLEKQMRNLNLELDRKYNFAVTLPEESKQTRRYNTSKTNNN